MSPRYEERLAARIRAADSRLCVGLDPRPDRIDGPVEDFVRRVIDETAPSVAAYKPNAAYFEALGLPGLRLLEQLRGWIPDDIPLILDGKRGDIPETNRAYARACFDVWGADAVTVNPWPGFDSLEPFLERPGKGVYLLAVMSNPGAADLQLLDCGGRPAWTAVLDMARRAADRPGTAGFVLGLTNVSPEILATLPDAPLLVPGLGAQGGRLDDLDVSDRRAPVVINSSRSILFGEGGPEQLGTRAAKAREAIHAALS